MNNQIAVRVAADIFITSVCIVVAFLVRYVYAIAFEIQAESGRQLFLKYVHQLSISLPQVVVLVVGSFFMFRVYSKIRSYSIYGKLSAVSKAVSLPYLLIPLIVYIVPNVMPAPRGVVFVAWMLNMLAAVASRFWSFIWKKDWGSGENNKERRSPEGNQVLLIGGAGYIGSALVPLLLDQGYKVRMLDLFIYGKEPLGQSVNHPNLELIHGDFRQVDKVVYAMRGVDSVIHLGGLVGDPACAVDEQLTVEINLVATRVIAEVAKGFGVGRFIFASTCSVYGASDGILDEKSKLNPVSLYAKSKIASEKVLFDLQSAKFRPTMLRFGTIFGLSGRTRFDLVVNLLTAKAVFDKKITLYGGDQWRPFVHVEDAARSVLVMLQSPIDRVGGEIFNVGGNQLNYTLQQVGEIIHRLVPGSELLELGTNSDRRNYRVDFSKVEKMVGFAPKWKLEDGVNQVITAIRDGVILDYNLPAYSNVKVLNQEMINHLGKNEGWERRVIQSVEPSEGSSTRS
jgi:nucleoside-diphosphate-sugar epimerase